MRRVCCSRVHRIGFEAGFSTRDWEGGLDILAREYPASTLSNAAVCACAHLVLQLFVPNSLSCSIVALELFPGDTPLVTGTGQMCALRTHLRVSSHQVHTPVVMMLSLAHDVASR